VYPRSWLDLAYLNMRPETMYPHAIGEKSGLTYAYLHGTTSHTLASGKSGKNPLSNIFLLHFLLGPLPPNLSASSKSDTNFVKRRHSLVTTKPAHDTDEILGLETLVAEAITSDPLIFDKSIGRAIRQIGLSAIAKSQNDRSVRWITCPAVSCRSTSR
jgi:hypothetical protein